VSRPLTEPAGLTGQAARIFVWTSTAKEHHLSPDFSRSLRNPIKLLSVTDINMDHRLLHNISKATHLYR
jgi:hypothetical protein